MTRIAAWLTTAKWHLRRENGQAMVEYTILLGIITVAAIVAILAVGGWIGDQWDALKTNLGIG